MIDGVLLTDEKIIETPGGDVLHGIKRTDGGFVDFGEAYLSICNYRAVKAWKRHRNMTLNLLVPHGKIRFVIFDDRKKSKTNSRFQEVVLSKENYKRLTIPPMVWLGFQGLERNENIILNIANIPHDPEEVDRVKIEEITFDWES